MVGEVGSADLEGGEELVHPRELFRCCWVLFSGAPWSSVGWSALLSQLPVSADSRSVSRGYPDMDQPIRNPASRHGYPFPRDDASVEGTCSTSWPDADDHPKIAIETEPAAIAVTPDWAATGTVACSSPLMPQAITRPSFNASA